MANSNPEYRRSFPLKSRIPTFKKAKSRIPKNLLGTLYTAPTDWASGGRVVTLVISVLGTINRGLTYKTTEQTNKSYEDWRFLLRELKADDFFGESVHVSLLNPFMIH